MSMPSITHMQREIMAIPDAVDAMLSDGAEPIKRAAQALADLDPDLVMTVARGSSDHAAAFFKYACALIAGVPVASVGPSIASVYQSTLRLRQTACLSISQSGQSPDIVQLTTAAAAQGALSIALTNNADSPLAKVGKHALLLHAGPERSVAATKTFVNSAVSALWLLAEWRHDSALRDAIFQLPRFLEDATKTDWSCINHALVGRPSLFCLGRGPALAMAQETALKFKETCQIHAEAFSSAEVLHGPVSIVDEGFPIVALAAADKAEASMAEVADIFAAKGARVFVTSDMVKTATPLPVIRTNHPLTDPIALIVSAYVLIEKVATTSGINPDAPRHLKKITETI